MSKFRQKLELRFELLAHFIFRHRFKTLFTMMLLMCILFANLSKISIDISTEGFLHKQDPTLVAYNQFRDQFGRDEQIVVAIEAPSIFNRLFLAKLKKLHEELEQNVPYIEDISSLINARDTRGEKDRLIVDELMQHWPETEQDLNDLRARVSENPIYKNLLISEDGKMTGIVLRTQTYSSEGADTDVLDGFSEVGQSQKPAYISDAENSAAVMKVEEIVKKYNTPVFKTYIAGSSAVSHFLKHAMIKDVRKFLIFAFLTIGLFLWIMFRRASGVFIPMMIVIVSLLSTISLMAIFGVPIKLPTQVLPSFILAVSVGDSVHILALFFFQLRKTRDKEQSIAYALGHSGLPVIMTSLTTAAGLFSFSTSEVSPIADLGIFAGIGVLMALIYTIVLLPALLAVFPVKIGAKQTDTDKETLTGKMMRKIAYISVNHPYKIITISALLMFVSVFGILKVKFSHDPLRWLPKDNSVRIATEKIDKDMKGSITMEIVLDTGKENGLYDPNLMNRLEKAVSYFETMHVGRIFAGKAWSITTILKETNQALHENRKAFYTVPQNRELIAQELLLFENSGSDDLKDFTDSQLSKARLMIKVPFEDAVAYHGFIAQMNQYLKTQFPDVSITTTGMTTLLVRTLYASMQSMAKSYIYALIVITLFMIVLIGRLRIGILSMLPNLAPILLTLGIIGWFKIPMSMFTMLVGNIAIGLAVDDTIHFMHHFQRYYDQTGDARFAVTETLNTSGRAMLITSCVLSVGFFIFMLASMHNLFHFGLLTGLTIILALLADYFLSPALMIVATQSNFFYRKISRREPCTQE